MTPNKWHVLVIKGGGLVCHHTSVEDKTSCLVDSQELPASSYLNEICFRWHKSSLFASANVRAIFIFFSFFFSYVQAHDFSQAPLSSRMQSTNGIKTKIHHVELRISSKQSL